jgi:hypothetical protein
MTNEPVQATMLVVHALEELGVLYLIGGSLASAVHGVMRATMDTDIVADLQIEQAESLARRLSVVFYADAEMMRDAIEHHGSFNVVHLETMFKVDVFIPKERDFDRSQLSRRSAQTISVDPEETAYVASAEDTILAKLEWYRMGGELSDRQWRDVLGILRVQTDRLDYDYMRIWAGKIKVKDLLEKALAEAGFDENSAHG